ncbi:hypothetical protein GGR57DRAFT_519012 [Xylariaceae sp. FL1272]|nr:hypothetical protein GGR57DRAFT_519012 [Xylariaceae sp. FL1272]
MISLLATVLKTADKNVSISLATGLLALAIENSVHIRIGGTTGLDDSEQLESKDKDTNDEVILDEQLTLAVPYIAHQIIPIYHQDLFIGCANVGLTQLVDDNGDCFFSMHERATSRLLSAAIRGKNASLIDFVMSRKPKLNPSPHHIPTVGKNRIMYVKTTPLAEALLAKKEKLFTLFYDVGVLASSYDDCRCPLAL